MVNRFAVLLAAAFAVAAALLAFLPSSSGETSCGIWASPNIGKAEAKSAVNDLSELSDLAGTVDGQEEVSANASATANGLAAAYRACDDKLDSRRMWTFIAFGAALVATPAVLLVAGLDEDQTATAYRSTP